MREKKYFLISCFAFVVLMMGLAGCSTDKESATNPNGVSAPAPETPENTTYNVTIEPNFVICGVNGSGVVDTYSACEFLVTVLDEGNVPVVDATVELRWSTSHYPNRVICSVPSGVTGSLVNGVQKLFATTDAYGVAHFRAAGGYDGTSSCTANTAAKYGRVFIDGEEQTPPGGAPGWFVVSAVDLNNTAGLNAADWSLFLSAQSCGTYLSRIDYNGSLTMDAQDEAIFTAIDGGGSEYNPCE